MRRFLAALVATVSLTLGVTILPAGAGNFVGPQNHNPRTDQCCWTDNANLYWFDSLGPSSIGQLMLNYGVKATLYNSYDTTRINVFRDTGYHPTTDVYYYFVNNLPETTLGITTCLAWNGAPYECERFEVRFHGDRMEAAGWGNDNAWSRSALKAVACHETGHAVGLDHGEFADPPMSNTSGTIRCMQDPIDLADPYVGTHNQGHIDGHY